ncbi:MAG: T9SS type A sorting domain-containing protein [Bacteroidota bacterium]
MKRYILLLLLTSALHNSNAQSGVADNWFFGVLCGMKFSSTVAVAIPSSMYTNEGCSGISDSSGSPLFYTDGVTVWNHLNTAMPNGTGLMGSPSATQSALIVPDPASNSEYYIFTVTETGGPDGFRYSKVDMLQQTGNGDVTTKNVAVKPDVTEKLTAVMNRSTGNYWVAVHENNSDGFYIYQLSPTGLAAPVVSNTGIVHNNSVIQNTYGQMKFNTCGNRIALAAGYLDVVEIFDFNLTTGVVSNPVSLPIGSHVYGVEFSNSGRYLYVSCYDPLGTLLQFDLMPGNAPGILATKTALSQTPDIYGLQLANNQKIYVCKSFSQFMGTIDNPEGPGLLANYIDANVFLDPNSTGSTSSLSLPGFVTSTLGIKGPCLVTSVSENTEEQNQLLYPNPAINSFHIMMPYAGTDLYIYDSLGKLIKYKTGLSQGNNLVPLNNIDAGVYTVAFESKGRWHHQQLIKINEAN